MKCFDCLNLLAEYLDGEASEHDAALVSTHLITCAGCTAECEALTAEQEIFTRYDRELSIPPSMWQAIEARTIESRPADSKSRFSLRAWFTGLLALPRYGLAGAMALLIVGLVIGVMYFRTRTQIQIPADLAVKHSQTPIQQPIQIPVQTPDNRIAAVKPPLPGPPSKLVEQSRIAQVKASPRFNRMNPSSTDQSDVLFSPIAYSDIENKDTADHIAQAENLLRSIRNIHLPDNEDEIDVTYEKAMSRRLLDQNVVLRRDAETSGKYPIKTLLGDLEPFLIEITNLPDKTTPSELRALRDRVQKTEIVAALQSY